jgi:hypothetical protein
VRSAAALLTLAVASSGCGVNVEIPTWSMELVEPLDDDGQLTFCPLAGRSLQEETGIDRFLPEPNVVVALSTDEDKDIHTFSSPGLGVPGQAGLSSGLSGLFGGGMIFDLGPIGTAYDDGAEVPFTLGTASGSRRLLDGSRRADDEIELRYVYTPSCTVLPLQDGGECTCETAVLTWRFVGVQ